MIKFFRHIRQNPFLNAFISLYIIVGCNNGWGFGFLWSDSSRKFDLRKLAPLGEGGCVEIIKLL